MGFEVVRISGICSGRTWSHSNRCVIFPHQGRRMIETMQRAKTLVTTGTALPQIPVRHDIPQEAVFRIGCDLLEACLTAILALGPARASIQAKSTPTKKRTRSRRSRCNIHRLRL